MHFSPQYFIRLEEPTARRLLLSLTQMPLEECDRLFFFTTVRLTHSLSIFCIDLFQTAATTDPALRLIQRTLAYQITSELHGEKAAKSARVTHTPLSIYLIITLLSLVCRPPLNFSSPVNQCHNSLKTSPHNHFQTLRFHTHGSHTQISLSSKPC